MSRNWALLSGCALLAPITASIPAYGGSSSPGVVITSVSAGFGDPNGVVPTFNAASGAGTPTLDIPIPRAILRIGNLYSMTMQNTTFNGQCTTKYTLTQVQGGVTVTLDSGLYQKKFACAPSNVFLWDLSGKPIDQSWAGPATLTAIVDYGKKTTKLSVPVLIEQ